MLRMLVSDIIPRANRGLQPHLTLAAPPPSFKARSKGGTRHGRHGFVPVPAPMPVPLHVHVPLSRATRAARTVTGKAGPKSLATHEAHDFGTIGMARARSRVSRGSRGRARAAWTGTGAGTGTAPRPFGVPSDLGLVH